MSSTTAGAADARALDDVPDHVGLGAGHPVDQAVHSEGNHPRLIFDRLVSRIVAAGEGVNVERGNVAAFHVLRVIFRVVGPRAASPPAVPGHSLAQVKKHRPRCVVGLHVVIAVDDLRRQGRQLLSAGRDHDNLLQRYDLAHQSYDALKHAFRPKRQHRLRRAHPGRFAATKNNRAASDHRLLCSSEDYSEG